MKMGDVPCQMTSGRGVSVPSSGRGDAAATERAAEPYSSCDIERGLILAILKVEPSIDDDRMYRRESLPELARVVGSGRTRKLGLVRLILSGSLGNWGRALGSLCNPCLSRRLFLDISPRI